MKLFIIGPDGGKDALLGDRLASTTISIKSNPLDVLVVIECIVEAV